jgi:hypothetical protein
MFASILVLLLTPQKKKDAAWIFCIVYGLPGPDDTMDGVVPICCFRLGENSYITAFLLWTQF